MTLRVEHDAFGITERMPLIERIIKHSSIRHKKPLRRYALLAVQHLQGSIVPLLAALVKSGIDATNVFVVGKAYSSHANVIKYMRKLRFNVVARNEMRSPSNPYESEIIEAIDASLVSIIKLLENNPRYSVLILDEGGKAIHLLHDKYADWASRFRCVEQTTRGIREIASLALKCPVINVARSNAKQIYETPLIAESMYRNLEKELINWSGRFKLISKKVALLGYGVVGKAFTKKLLDAKYKVVVFDNIESTLKKAIRDGVNVSRDIKKVLKEVGLVVGCTGKGVLNDDLLKVLRPGLLLVNGASSDIEFSSWKLRSFAEIVYTRSDGLDLNPRLTPWRNLYKVSVPTGYFYLANGGFPINFDGSIDPIEPEKFQLTRALMFAGALHAASTQSKGLIELDLAFQRDILSGLSTLTEGKECHYV